MNPSLTHSLDDGASQGVSAPILKANAAAHMINVGNLPLSGNIIDKIGGNACRFIFAYGELPVSGEVIARQDQAELQLFIQVGVVPYTVESWETRKRLLGVVKSFNGKSTESVEIDRGQSIVVRGTALLDLPVTATRLISSMVEMLFELKPVLRSLADYLPDLAETIPDWGSNSAVEAATAVPKP